MCSKNYDKNEIKEWLNKKLKISNILPEITYKPLSKKSEIKKTIRNTNRCFNNQISVWLFNMWFNAAFLLTLITMYLIIIVYGNPLLWLNYLTLNTHQNVIDLTIASTSNCQSLTFIQNRINLIKSKSTIEDYYEEEEFTCYYAIKKSNPSSLLKLYNNGTKKYIGSRGTMAINNKVLKLIKFYIDNKNLNSLQEQEEEQQKTATTATNKNSYFEKINSNVKDYSYHIKSPNDACTDDPYCYNGMQENCCRTNLGLMPHEYWSNKNAEKLCDNPLLPCYACERGLDATPAGIITASDKYTKLMLYLCSGKEIYKSIDNIVYKNNYNNDYNNDEENDEEEEENYNDMNNDFTKTKIFPSSISRNNINNNILKIMDYNTCMSGRGSLKYLQGKCICKKEWAGLNCNTQVGMCKSKKYTLPAQIEITDNKNKEKLEYYKTCDGVLKIIGVLDNHINVTGNVKSTCLTNDYNNPHVIISHEYNECFCQCCYTDLDNGKTYCSTIE